MSLLRSVTFTVLMFLSVPPYSLLVCLGRVFGEASAYRLIIGWVRIMLALCRWLCGLRFQVEGAQNIPREPSVVLLKHSSAYETLAQLLLFPRQCWVLKRELNWVPFLGWALAAVRPIAINRGGGRQAVEQVIDQGKARLRAGIWVMIFPEGTRVAAGQTRRYGLSGTLLAQAADCRIVPVAHDAGYFWPRRGWRKRPGVVTFRIGTPVDPAGRDPRDVNDEIQTWVEAQIADLRRAQT